jgi:hypothetical protein
MGLRLKFNLVLLVVFLLGLGVTGYISYDLLHKNAREEVLRNAGVMMEAALSMRGYTVAQVGHCCHTTRTSFTRRPFRRTRRRRSWPSCGRSIPLTPTRKPR